MSGVPTRNCAPVWERTVRATAVRLAVADLREAPEGLIAEFGAPHELTLAVDVA